MTANVSARVIDNGLAVLDTEPDRLFICSQEPTDYPQASSTYRLGQKTFAVGTFFGAPQAGTGTPAGRRVASTAFSDGLVTSTGTATHWAVCDSVNLRLLATGTLAAPTAVVNSAAFGLPSFSVQVSVSMGLAVSGVSLNATVLAAASPVIGTPTVDGDLVTGWRTLKVGAGGWLTGMALSPDGLTKVIKADTFGAFVLDEATGIWSQLLTSNRVAGIPPGGDEAMGVFEVAVASSNSNVIYLANGWLDHILVSTNRGASFTATAFAHSMRPNADTRYYGPKMAVDPANAGVAYLVTDIDGVWTTANGGATWTQISTASLPVNMTLNGLAFDGDRNAGVGLVLFDTASGTTGGKTNGIYISVYGHGLYHSTNAGTSWSAVSGSPLKLIRLRRAVDGKLYVVQNNDSSSTIWRYDGAWTNITPSADFWTVVLCDPNNAAKIIAVRGGGYLNVSTTSGTTWNGLGTYAGHHPRVATDVPWLAACNEEYMSEGEMLFDPVVADKIWFAQGIGVWTTPAAVLPSSGPGNDQVWTSVSAGIEQLVACQVVQPPGGKPVIISGDRAVFYSNNQEVYPAVQAWKSDVQLTEGPHCDWASTDPTFLVIGVSYSVQYSAYSQDGGQTWTQFASYPSGPSNYAGYANCMAAASTDNFLWVFGSSSDPWYTLNRGATWTRINLSALGVTLEGAGETGWNSRGMFQRHYGACADRVNANTFYMANYGPSGTGAAPAGLYRSTDGGVTWTRPYTGNIVTYVRDYWNVKLKAVPGHAGHLVFCGSQASQGGPNPDVPSTLRRSTNGLAGTVTWSSVPHVAEPYDFGFGMPKPGGGGYPSVYIVGWVSLDSDVTWTYGVWRSDDFEQATPTWARLGATSFPNNWVDMAVCIEGDKNVYGRCYVGYQGSGYSYYAG